MTMSNVARSSLFGNIGRAGAELFVAPTDHEPTPVQVAVTPTLGGHFAPSGAVIHLNGPIPEHVIDVIRSPEHLVKRTLSAKLIELFSIERQHADALAQAIESALRKNVRPGMTKLDIGAALMLGADSIRPPVSSSSSTSIDSVSLVFYAMHLALSGLSSLFERAPAPREAVRPTGLTPPSDVSPSPELTATRSLGEVSVSASGSDAVSDVEI